MNRKVYTAILLVSVALFVASATILVTKAAPAIVLTPTSGAPGDIIDIDGTGFAVSNSTGIGFGPEVAVADEVVTVNHPTPSNFYGLTSKHPIKPGTFQWKYMRGAVQLTATDNGDGTLNDPSGFMASGTINYTSGFFMRTMSSTTMEYTGDTFSYTTYEFDVAPDGLGTNSSGMLSGNFTVPNIWNETHTVTVIDETGNIGTSDFTVVGSDFVPEALTIGAIVLLSSTAFIVSFYCLRKRSYTESVA